MLSFLYLINYMYMYFSIVFSFDSEKNLTRFDRYSLAYFSLIVPKGIVQEKIIFIAPSHRFNSFDLITVFYFDTKSVWFNVACLLCLRIKWNKINHFVNMCSVLHFGLHSHILSSLPGCMIWRRCFSLKTRSLINVIMSSHSNIIYFIGLQSLLYLYYITLPRILTMLYVVVVVIFCVVCKSIWLSFKCELARKHANVVSYITC